MGYALGLVPPSPGDLPPARLADTLPGFHVTPGYLRHYDEVRAGSIAPASPEVAYWLPICGRAPGLAPVLEDAKKQGKLTPRPIHGDPKVNNVMLDTATGQAVALVDLDTVKPGLVHYDIGDCLRSGCNPLGEETGDWEAVRFEPELGRAILSGYLPWARGFLGPDDYAYLYDAVRLLAFELGLRFFTDYLAGQRLFQGPPPGTQPGPGPGAIQADREHRTPGRGHPQPHPGPEMNGRDIQAVSFPGDRPPVPPQDYRQHYPPRTAPWYCAMSSGAIWRHCRSPGRPPTPAADGLWQETCLEFFLAPRDNPGYWEFNLSPAGHWNVYRFRDYRQGMTEAAAFTALPFSVQKEPALWHLTVEIDLARIIPADQALDAAASAVIMDRHLETTYWAMIHPGPQPDFHRRDAFLIDL